MTKGSWITGIACTLLLATSLLAAPTDGTLLTFRGHFEPVEGDATDVRKSFELSLLVEGEAGRHSSLHWTLSEEGQGQWAWPDRFGRADVDAQLQPGDTGPALLYEHDETASEVPLTMPFLAAKSPLAAGQSWQEGKLEYRVLASERVSGHETWKVEARNPYGHKRTVWVDKESPLVLRLEETVFIGQGQEHLLRMELVEAESLEAEAQQQLVTGFESLLGLREKLAHPPRSERAQWNEKQLETLEQQLPQVALATKAPLLAPLVEVAKRDLQAQMQRRGAVRALRNNLIGAKTPDFQVQDLAGKSFSQDDFRDGVAILHFWDYRESPLKEPYGQIGYLDFMHRKRADDSEVRIYGIAVNQQLADPASRNSGIRSVRKLRSFMNLSYPLMVDTAGALQQFGDPRVSGAELPLFVVLADGKVVHYHVGHYEVHRDRGLEQLDEVVRKALETRE